MKRSEAVAEAARLNARRQPDEPGWVVDWSWAVSHRPADMHLVRQIKPGEKDNDHLKVG